MGICNAKNAVVPATARAAPKARYNSAKSSKPIEIGYLTDLEVPQPMASNQLTRLCLVEFLHVLPSSAQGNLEYFNKWVERSRVLRYKPGTTTLELAHDSAYFVFGGDVQDRCGGSLRLTRRLVDLKKANPDRVFLICGNRDLNKLRLPSELGAGDMARPASEIPGPHWDPSAPTLHTYLTELAAQRGDGTTAEALDSRPERLRYYLKHTLGCPTTFEDRRAELAVMADKSASPSDELNGRNGATEAGISAITDDQVVDSFLDDVAEGGALYGYIEHGSLACLLGNTIFVHGCLDSSNIKLVPLDGTRFYCPPEPQPMKSVEAVGAWVKEMNEFLRRGLAAHVARPDWDDSRTTRGCDMLLAVQNRCAMWGRCVVSGAYADGGCITTPGAGPNREQVCAEVEESKNPILFEKLTSDPRDALVADWLIGGGVRRIVVGHKPSGDSPAVPRRPTQASRCCRATRATRTSKMQRGAGVASPRRNDHRRRVPRSGMRRRWGTLSDEK